MDFNKFQWDDFIDAANSRLKRLETIWKWLWDENLFNISQWILRDKISHFDVILNFWCNAAEKPKKSILFAVDYNIIRPLSTEMKVLV